MMPTSSPLPLSRKVQGLKRAYERLSSLQRTLETKRKALAPLEREVTRLSIEVTMRQTQLTGGQMAAWRQYLATRPDGRVRPSTPPSPSR